MTLDPFGWLLALGVLWVFADMITSIGENAKWRRFEESPVSVFCPRCGAKRGEWCRGLQTEFHVSREKLLEKIMYGGDEC